MKYLIVNFFQCYSIAKKTIYFAQFSHFLAEIVYLNANKTFIHIDQLLKPKFYMNDISL